MNDWSTLERRLGVGDLRRFTEREIIPHLSDVPREPTNAKGARTSRLELPISVGFFAFIILHITVMIATPATFFGEALTFILFVPLFFLCLGVSLYLFRHRLAAALADGQVRFVARSKALTALADTLGLRYAPAPGGAPASLKMLARQNWAPAALREAASVLDAHGGMDEAVDIARRSGVMVGDAAVLGDAETRAAYHAQQAHNVQIEDGFAGARGGVSFSAFEWIESGDESPDVHHLAMVFVAPRRLFGVTQLRSRHIAWPAAPAGVRLAPVGVVAPAFEDRFRMRASDQVEARAIFDPVVLERVADIAQGAKVRAAAFERYLVIDVEGEDRFAMVDLTTGAWSDETIVGAMENIADMLDLADAVAHAFKLRAAA